MAKKEKIKYEESNLNFRVSNKLKEEIQRRSEDKNITMSKYLRGLLEKIHDGSFERNIREMNAKKSYLYSKDFLRLITWVYSKKGARDIEESKEDLSYFVKVLKMADGYLPQELNNEFDKVLGDLIKLIKSDNIKYKSYDFASSYSENEKFNYDLVTKFLLSKKLEKFIEQGTDLEYFSMNN